MICYPWLCHTHACIPVHTCRRGRHRGYLPHLFTITDINPLQAARTRVSDMHESIHSMYSTWILCMYTVRVSVWLGIVDFETWQQKFFMQTLFSCIILCYAQRHLLPLVFFFSCLHVSILILLMYQWVQCTHTCSHILIATEDCVDLLHPGSVLACSTNARTLASSICTLRVYLIMPV